MRALGPLSPKLGADEAELTEVHETLAGLEAKCAQALVVQRIDASDPRSWGARERTVMRHLQKALRPGATVHAVLLCGASCVLRGRFCFVLLRAACCALQRMCRSLSFSVHLAATDAAAQVEEAQRGFEDRLWAQLRSAPPKQPAPLYDGAAGAPALVRVLRVVQQQEAAEQALLVQAAAEAAAAAAAAAEEAEHGGRGAVLPLAHNTAKGMPGEAGCRGGPKPKGYRAKALAAVEKSIDDFCAARLRLRRPGDTERGGGEDESEGSDGEESSSDGGGGALPRWLRGVGQLQAALEEMRQHAVPCFPPSFRIWELLVRRAHARLLLFFDAVAADVGACSQARVGHLRTASLHVCLACPSSTPLSAPDLHPTFAALTHPRPSPPRMRQNLHPAEFRV